MSIANRHPNINDVLNPPKTICSQKWTLIYFIPLNQYLQKEYDIWKFFLKYSIETINHNFNIENTYIYTYPENDIIDNLNAEIVYLHPGFKSSRLSIIDKLMLVHKNVIFLQLKAGYIHLDANNQINDICSKLSRINDLKYTYQAICQKFNIEEIVDSSILIIPHSDRIQRYINTSFNVSNQLEIEDEEMVTNISLTIVNMKFENLVRKVDTLKNFICYEPKQKCYCNLIRELYYKKINYHIDHGNYIYYPYLDIDSDPIAHITDMPNICNTNGFWYVCDKNWTKLVFKRFDDINSGIYVKKDLAPAIIPKILHCILIDENDNVDLWGRILRDPWKYQKWRINDLEHLDHKWRTLYYHEKDPLVQQLIFKFAILAKHGGIVINSDIIPLRVFPDQILMNEVFAGFVDESLGPIVSHRVIGMPNVEFGLKQQLVIENMYYILSNKEVDRFEQLNHFMISHFSIYPSYYFNQNMSTSKILWSLSISKCKIKNEPPMVTQSRTPVKRIYIVTPRAMISKLNEDPKDRIKNNRTN